MSTPITAAPYLAATLILGAAGVAKFWDPSETARALEIAGSGGGDRRRIALPYLVRLGAAAEVMVAVAALVRPNALTGILVALSYGGFAAFLAAALVKRWPLSSCGCFGRKDTEPRAAHLALDIGAAVAAAFWSASPPRSLLDVFHHQPAGGLPLVLVSVVIAGLALAVWTDPLARARGQT